MRHASLFSGIGAPDLAAEWMGWENVFHCEINSFGQKTLQYYWPNSISYENIITTDFTIHRGGVDIITGGFPCQPFSHAGKREGKEDDRYLWPEMLRAISEIRPTWVIGENVAGIRSMGIEQSYSTLESNEVASQEEIMVIEEIRQSLEAIGYELQPFIIPACAVDAPHRRDRIWFVAYRIDGWNESLCEQEAGPYKPFVIADTSSERYKGRPASDWSQQNQAEWRNLQFLFAGPGEEWPAPNSNDKGIQRGTASASVGESRTDSYEQSWGHYQLNDWGMFPTQSPVCDGDDGFFTAPLRQRIREDCMGIISEKEIDQILSSAYSQWRTETIKAGGNAIVPQVIYQIFKVIQQYEDQLK